MNKLMSKLNNMGDELSNMGMDDNGNFYNKKKQGQYPQQGGQDFGFGQPPSNNNNYHQQPPQQGGYYGAPNQGYGQNNFNSHPQGQASFGRPGDFEDYAPPPGPPPGHHGHHGQQPPPFQQGPPPPGAYVQPQMNQYGPPPGQGMSQGQGYGRSQGGGPRLNVPQRFEVWYEMAGNGQTYFGISQSKNDSLYYGRFPNLTGRFTVYQGDRKQGGGGREVAKANDSGISRSSSTITMPDGFKCELKKSSGITSDNKGYSFTMPIQGRGDQTFVWKAKSGGTLNKMMGVGGGGLQLMREGDQGNPLAVFTKNEDMGFSSRSGVGSCELVGEGATGALGDKFGLMVVVTILKIQQKDLEKQIMKAVT